jgi:hypothetical protein
MVLLVALLFAPVAGAINTGAELIRDLRDMDTFLSAGLLVSSTNRSHGGTGIGGELSVSALRNEAIVKGGGAFIQAQWVGGDHLRLCGGAQFNIVVFGAELGLARDFAGEESPAVTSLHFAPFLSVGVLAVSMPIGVPLGFLSDDRAGNGVQIGIALALKIPVRVNR